MLLLEDSSPILIYAINTKPICSTVAQKDLKLGDLFLQTQGLMEKDKNNAIRLAITLQLRFLFQMSTIQQKKKKKVPLSSLLKLGLCSEELSWLSAEVIS